MEVQLKAFLEKCKVKKGEPFTHTTKSTGSLENGWPASSYYISKEHAPSFMKIYRDVVKSKCKLTITEKPGQFVPLRADFDFKSDLDTGIKRQYTIDMLKKIVSFFQCEIKKIIHPDTFNENMLWCMILEKPSPRKENGIVKDGFHLHFPHFICEEWIQDKYIRDRVLKHIIEEKVFGRCNFKTPIDEVYDKLTGKVWMMYGSMNYQNPHSSPYLYHKWKKVPENQRYGYIFDHNQQEITVKQLFSVYHDNIKHIKYHLPELLSIRGYSQPVQLLDEISRRKVFEKKSIKMIQKKRSEEEIFADIKTLKDGMIMDMLSNDRADNYSEWMDVGWTLFNIGEGRDETLDMWIEFSRRSSKFIEGECEKVWNTMQLGEKTIASLLYMARNDSPDDYKRWKESHIRNVLFKSLDEQKPNEYDVSLVVVKMFGDKFKCADAKRGLWYYYHDHRWRPMDNEIELRRKIVEDVLSKYAALQYELGEKVNDVEHRLSLADKDSDESKSYSKDFKEIMEKRKKCRNIITRLKEVDFQRKVISMCQIQMHDSHFMKKINENRNYIGCENGVIDLELKIFRDGRPDDYITFTTEQFYTEYNEEDEEVKELHDYLSKVYPNKNIREYFLDFIATSLKGNINKRFGIFTGASDGAKSMTFTLLEKAFGSGQYGYFGKFPRELMVQSTTKNSSSSSRPELARVRGKIFMASQEITKMEKMNIGFVKEATGNDSIYVRSHYEQGTEIRPNFTMMIACNEPPEIPGHDEAVWSRIRVIDHESKFVKPQDIKKWPVPSSEEEQFKMKRFRADPSFGERIPILANVMLWLVFQRYKKCSKTKELHEPQEVLISTEKYQNDNDIYRKFYADKIEKVQNVDEAKKTVLKLQNVFSLFREWYKEEYPSYRDTIGKGTFKNELCKKMGVIRNPEDVYGFDDKKHGWVGYREIQQDNEELSFEDN